MLKILLMAVCKQLRISAYAHKYTEVHAYSHTYNHTYISKNAHIGNLEECMLKQL